MTTLKIAVSAAIAFSVLATLGCSADRPNPQAAATPTIMPAAPPAPEVAAAPMAPPVVPDPPMAVASSDPPMAAATDSASTMDTTMSTERAPRADRN